MSAWISASAAIAAASTTIPADGDPPYRVTVGDEDAPGEVDFFLFTHHTPRLARNLISLDDALQGAAWFLDNGGLAPFLTWEEV